MHTFATKHHLLNGLSGTNAYHFIFILVEHLLKHVHTQFGHPCSYIACKNIAVERADKISRIIEFADVTTDTNDKRNTKLKNYL